MKRVRNKNKKKLNYYQNISVQEQSNNKKLIKYLLIKKL
jgi:hypothetical protein